MSEHERPTSDETFQQKLKRLRMRIDPPPEPHRPHLYDPGDTIPGQRGRLQDRKPSDHDSD